MNCLADNMAGAAAWPPITDLNSAGRRVRQSSKVDIAFAFMSPRHLMPLVLQALRQIVELFEIAIADADDAAFAAMSDTDDQAERIGQPLFQRQRVGVLFRRLLARLRTGLAVAAGFLARDFLDLTNVEAARHNIVREFFGIGLADQHAGMAGV